MSQRPGPPAAQRPHVHCESCYSRRCRARPEASACCALAPCPLLCGAVFHLCKEAEHSLLCPERRVPCLNAAYGCPLVLTRRARAAHLRSCPASVVCCSMEWNRWPADDAHAHPRRELHDNLLRERGGGGGSGAASSSSPDLELAMALRDQDHLFHDLKMKTLFPELCESRQDERNREEEEKKKMRKKKKDDLEEKERREVKARTDGDTWDHMSWVNIQLPEEDGERRRRRAEEGDGERRRRAEEEEEDEEEEPSQEEREAVARGSGVNPECLQSYAAWERMFSKDMGGCREAAGGADRNRGAEKGVGLSTLREEEPETSTACVTKHRERFVYGHVEPMKIINVRTFKVPTSFSARPERIRNPAFCKKKESRAVDTRDLGVGLEDMPVWEEVQASLLCLLEKEQRGHLIAEGTSTDTLLQEVGTQTYSFLSAPFRSGACLADLAVGRSPELHLQLQLEAVSSRHHKASSAFTFLCGHSFPRREYGTHFRNVHSDIQTCVSGWFEQRCPLAYLGCTYSQRRFQPSTHEATVTYNQELSCFSLRPAPPGGPAGHDSDPPGTPPSAPPVARRRKGRGGGGGGGGGGEEDSLSALPYEALCHMAGFLDSLSLSQLALVSHLLRDVCASLLRDRGVVTLRWQKEVDAHGGAKWRAGQKVWSFSTLFSPVSEWCFQDVPHMSEHLKVCPFYQREHRTQRVRLPRVGERTKTKTPHKNPSLVTAFKDSIMM